VVEVLVVTPDAGAADAIRGVFSDAVLEVAGSLGPDGKGSPSGTIDYLFIDVGALEGCSTGDEHSDGFSAVKEMFPGTRVVVMSPQAQIREAILHVREGAADYLTYPVVHEEVQLVRESIERRERLSSELRYFRDRSLDAESVGSITSRAGSMKTVLRKIRQVAPTRSTVLLTGETGTGKSFLAKVIHQNSTRASRQFVSVHCGAIPDTLLESELFGHERGAFTGADRRKLGKFEIANGGTLFLDEIATITPAMQVKLLGALQDRMIQRVGGDHDVQVDVRILAATNIDLEQLSRDGGFRPDLFYRLNVFPIEIPPLRDRREDIPDFVEHFLDRLRLFHQKQVDRVEAGVMGALVEYDWPGNVRELENLLERAFILEQTSTLTAESFPDEIFEQRRVGRLSIDPRSPLADVRQRAIDHAERLYLSEQLAVNQGRIDATAKAAGITARQLHKLMTKHRLKKEEFKRPTAGKGNRDSDDGEKRNPRF
jgi:DNA-binding NtrC family response regulator